MIQEVGPTTLTFLSGGVELGGMSLTNGAHL